MTVQIGINPLTWSNDDMPALGADIPLEVCLSEARQAGYAGIELGHKFPRDAATLRPLLERVHQSGTDQEPILASTSARRNLSMNNMNPTDGTSRMSAVMEAI